MSHTVKVKVAFKDGDALGRAAIALGGTCLGQGQHQLFSSTETGVGIQLPGWRFPLVARADGTLAFDDFNGSWGNRADLDKLKQRYAIECARLAAESQGWMCQETGGELLIFHPDGGTLTVTADGKIDANQFEGESCSLATHLIANAVGKPEEETMKNDFFAERAHIVQTE